MFPFMGEVKAFDIGKGHIGVLKKDNTVFNFNCLVPPEEVEKTLTYLEKGVHSVFDKDIGAIKLISSGEGFNLLVTEADEVFAQNLPNSTVNYYELGQPIGGSLRLPLYKVDMISDYNSIHGTKVSPVVLLKRLIPDQQGQVGPQIEHGAPD